MIAGQGASAGRFERGVFGWPGREDEFPPVRAKMFLESETEQEAQK